MQQEQQPKRSKPLQRQRIFRLVGTVVGFSLLALLIWMITAWVLMSAVPFKSKHWSWLEGVTSVGALAFAVGAGVWVMHEYSEALSTRDLEIYRDIYEKFMTDEQIDSRRYIYQEFPDDPQEAIHLVEEDPEARLHYKRVVSVIDYFGFLVDQQWVTDDQMIGWVSPIVVKVWKKVRPIVEHECAARPEEPDYHQGARSLYARCVDWREANLREWTEDAIAFRDDAA
jgi:hypothetical protein